MVDGIKISLTGADDLKARLDAIVEACSEAALEIVQAGAVSLVAQAQAGFSGSHGKNQPHTGGAKPNVVSGTLRRSIRIITPPTMIAPGFAAATVGPTVIYGRRVELGFKGPDSLGRVFRKTPPSGGLPGSYPYMTPALGRVRAGYLAMAATKWSAALAK